MKTLLANTKAYVREHPVEAVIIATLAFTATAKLIDAVGHYRGATAYAKQINAKLSK